jgi:hypothetical protein
MSAREPKQIERFAFRQRSGQRRTCCVPSRASPQQCSKCNVIALRAVVDAIEMHLGQVTRAAAALMAQNPHASKNLMPEITAGEGVQRQLGVPQFCHGRSPLRGFALVQSLRASRLLAPDFTPLRLLRAPRSPLVLVGGLLAITSLPAITGLVVMKLPMSTYWEWRAADPTFELASSPPLTKNLAPVRSELEPRLVVHASGGIAGEPVPLGLTMQGHADGAVVIITGLIPGMSLSTGNATGADTWQLPTTNFGHTWVGPPVGFVGVVSLAAELHLDGAVLQRLPIRIEWIATSPAAAAQVPTTPSLGEALATPQQLDHDEIALQAHQTAERQGETTHQKRGANKIAVSIPRKGTGKASSRRRASKKPVYALPTQLTRGSWSGW